MRSPVPVRATCAEIDKNLFRGSQLWTPDGARGVFGGQIIAQSLFAAARTRTESEKAMAPHSLHCYFLLPGSSESPALYTVRRVRDGRSFATRLVTTTQRGRPIFSSMVSFHSTREPTTLEHADAMPDAPDPDTLPNVRGWASSSTQWGRARLRSLPAPRAASRL